MLASGIEFTLVNVTWSLLSLPLLPLHSTSPAPSWPPSPLFIMLHALCQDSSLHRAFARAVPSPRLLSSPLCIWLTLVPSSCLVFRVSSSKTPLLQQPKSHCPVVLSFSSPAPTAVSKLNTVWRQLFVLYLSPTRKLLKVGDYYHAYHQTRHIICAQ